MEGQRGFRNRRRRRVRLRHGGLREELIPSGHAGTLATLSYGNTMRRVRSPRASPMQASTYDPRSFTNCSHLAWQHARLSAAKRKSVRRSRPPAGVRLKVRPASTSRIVGRRLRRRWTQLRAAGHRGTSTKEVRASSPHSALKNRAAEERQRTPRVKYNDLAPNTFTQSGDSGRRVKTGPRFGKRVGLRHRVPEPGRVGQGHQPVSEWQTDVLQAASAAARHLEGVCLPALRDAPPAGQSAQIEQGELAALAFGAEGGVCRHGRPQATTWGSRPRLKTDMEKICSEQSGNAVAVVPPA